MIYTEKVIPFENRAGGKGTGEIHIAMEDPDLEGRAKSVMSVILHPGTSIGSHQHVGNLELYYVIKGEGIFTLNGESFPIHEFHHWDSTANGAALAAKKPVGGAAWRCGFVNEHFYAGFPHLYWAGTPLPQRFAAAAENYRRDHD
mgnify:CR=1 FL=1